MGPIGTVKLAYKDVHLSRYLASFTKPLQKMPDHDLPKYVHKFVTLPNLEKNNISFMFEGNKPEITRCLPTDEINAFSDTILFSSKSREVTTNAGACSSYFLFCEKTRIAAAVHVDAEHVKEHPFHLKMLRYAYANLMQVAPEDPVSAYISGMNINFGAGFEITSSLAIVHHRTTIASVVWELLSRGININVIDIGGNYKYQLLDLANGKYETV